MRETDEPLGENGITRGRRLLEPVDPLLKRLKLALDFLADLEAQELGLVVVSGAEGLPDLAPATEYRPELRKDGAAVVPGSAPE
jgi:hypothetical protein